MATTTKPPCKYGAQCYRTRNKEHMKQYSHPSPPKAEDVESGVPEKRKRRLSSNDALLENTDDKQECAAAVASQSSEDAKISLEIPHFPDLDSRKQFIEQRFLVRMPPDFYAVWDLARRLNSAKPLEAFAVGGLHLVGPFDVLAGKFDQAKGLTEADFLAHWRYFFDPPEFQTVMKGNDKDQFHIGYFRDEPQGSAIVCANSAAKDCNLKVLGDNLFAAIFTMLCAEAKASNDAAEVKKICAEVEKAAKASQYSLDAASQAVRARKKNVVAATFHGAGIVVPMKGDVGYRELPETNANLKKMITGIADAEQESSTVRAGRLEKLEEIITYVQFANDECDYGMGYELGIDLFCSGYTCVQAQARALLDVAYPLLQRDAFAAILRAHLTNRRRGSRLSIV